MFIIKVALSVYPSVSLYVCLSHSWNVKTDIIRPCMVTTSGRSGIVLHGVTLQAVVLPVGLSVLPGCSYNEACDPVLLYRSSSCVYFLF